jgi:hypothetical protein
MASRVPGHAEEINVDFSVSAQKKSRKAALIISGLLVFFLVLGFTIRSTPKPALPTLNKVGSMQPVGAGNLYYVSTTYDKSKNLAETIYYLDAPQTDSALTTKVGVQITSGYGVTLNATIYQAGAHIFAVDYHPDAATLITSQSVTVDNITANATSSNSSSDPVVFSVVPSEQNSKIVKPNYRSLALLEVNYQIHLAKATISEQEDTINTALAAQAKDNQTIGTINAQNPSTLTTDQSQANNSQLAALSADVSTQQTTIDTAKNLQSQLQANLKKTMQNLVNIQNSKTDAEIAKVLG